MIDKILVVLKEIDKSLKSHEVEDYQVDYLLMEVKLWFNKIFGGKSW